MNRDMSQISEYNMEYTSNENWQKEPQNEHFIMIYNSIKKQKACQPI